MMRLQTRRNLKITLISLICFELSFGSIVMTRTPNESSGLQFRFSSQAMAAAQESTSPDSQSFLKLLADFSKLKRKGYSPELEDQAAKLLDLLKKQNFTEQRSNLIVNGISKSLRDSKLITQQATTSEAAPPTAAAPAPAAMPAAAPPMPHQRTVPTEESDVVWAPAPTMTGEMDQAPANPASAPSAPAAAPAPAAAAPMPASAPRAGMFAAPSPTTSVIEIPDAGIFDEQTLKSDPETRKMLLSFSQARLEQVSASMKDQIEARNAERAKLAEMNRSLPAPTLTTLIPDSVSDAFQIILKMADLRDDVVDAYVSALLKKYEWSPVDTIAEKLIDDATNMSMLAGGIQGAIGPMVSNVLPPIAGMTTEQVATYYILTLLSKRLARLYGIKMSDYQTELMTYGAVAVIRTAAMMNLSDKEFTRGKMESLGKLLAQTKAAATGRAAMAKLQAHIAKIALVQNPSVRLSDADKQAVTDQTAPSENKATPEVARSRITKVLTSNLALSLLQGTISGFVSREQAYYFGTNMRDLYRAAMLEERRMQQTDFLNFLFSPHGEAYFKLLILAVSSSEQRDGLIDPDNRYDDRVTFIMSLARSTRACSERDMEAIHATNTRAIDTSPQVIDESKLSQVEKIRRRECMSGSTRAHQRIRREFLTYNEVPESLMAEIRMLELPTRLKMAEYLIQIQYLNRDRSPDEYREFQKLTKKILGLESIQATEYLNKYAAYVNRQSMEPTVESPTGYRVKVGIEPLPYSANMGTEGPSAASVSN